MVMQSHLTIENLVSTVIATFHTADVELYIEAVAKPSQHRLSSPVPLALWHSQGQRWMPWTWSMRISAPRITYTHTYLVSWNAWFHTAYPHDVVLTETLAGNACVLEAIRSGSETPVDEDFGSLDEDFGILRMMPQTPSEHRGSKISCLWSECNTELEASHKCCRCNSAYCFSFLPPFTSLGPTQRCGWRLLSYSMSCPLGHPVCTASGTWMDRQKRHQKRFWVRPLPTTWIWEICLRRRAQYLAHRLRRCVGGGEAPDILAAKGEK